MPPTVWTSPWDKVYCCPTAALLLPSPRWNEQGILPFCRFCRKYEEPTSGLEPLTPALYEFACGYPDVYHPATVHGLAKPKSQSRWLRPSYCVPARLQHSCST